MSWLVDTNVLSELARPASDLLIAATAAQHGLTVVTRNVRDFDGCGVAVLNPFADPGPETP